MNKKYKYQILFFGDRSDLLGAIKDLFLKKADELKLEKDSFVFLSNEEATAYKGNQPAFSVYANSTLYIADSIVAHLRHQKSEGNAILPLFEKDFAREIDNVLSEFNGQKIDEGIDRIVNHILEGFNLLRRRRKLFISYRRTDSRAVALQLFEYFESLNYDVFLDTHSVPKASHFQNQLWHNMSDSDIVILLDTDDFLNSEWCPQELSFAENKRIAILRLKFPSSSIPDDNSAILSTIKLTDTSFDGDKLVVDLLPHISQQVESLRARALASRQDNLISELINAGRNHSKNIIRIDQKLLRMNLHKEGKNEEYLFVPAVGVPQSSDFHSVDEELKQEISKAKDIYLIYDDTSLLKSWTNHLKWLDSQLRINSLCISDFNNFFQNL